MKNLGLIAITINKFRPKKSKSCDLELPNHLNGVFKASKINTNGLQTLFILYYLRWLVLFSISYGPLYSQNSGLLYLSIENSPIF
jgi:hypothetical protein